MLKKAFSLLELSIVIAVMAVLLSAISVATNLVANSNLLATMQDVEKYSRAIITFKAKYEYYPGDYSSAYASFGSDCAGGSSASCNGDGDGSILWHSSSVSDNEYVKVFHHLYLAKIVSEPFSDSSFGVGSTDLEGNVCAGGGASIIGKTTPALPIENATLGLQSTELLYLGGYRCGYPMYGVITPGEAQKYDSKYDDGVRNTGIITGHDGLDVTSGDCVTGSGALYNLAKTNNACFITYKKFEGGL